MRHCCRALRQRRLSDIARKSHAEIAVVQLVNETRVQVRRDALLRLPQVEAVTGLKKSTIYLLMKRKEFVPCVQLTARCVAWPESRVLQWVQDRIASTDAAPAQPDLLNNDTRRGA
jgi:prophage regulatory protein